MSCYIVEAFHGGLADLDMEYSMYGQGCDVDLKCAFDVPASPPASCSPTPETSPSLKQRRDFGNNGEGDGKGVPSPSDWSQTITLEAFEALEDGISGSDTSGKLIGTFTPPRSPMNKEGLNTPFVTRSPLFAFCDEELPDVPEGGVAHINPTMIHSTTSLFGLEDSSMVTSICNSGEEEGDVDVETLDEFPLSGAELLCLNQRLLLQQQQRHSSQPFTAQTITMAPGVSGGLRFANVLDAQRGKAIPEVPRTKRAGLSAVSDDSHSPPENRLRYAPYIRPAGQKDPEQKRHTHNLLERRRREDLKTTFDILAAVVPEVANDSRCSRLQVLQAATEQVKKLREDNQSAAAMRDSLRAENTLLLERLGQMRKQLRAKGIVPCV